VANKFGHPADWLIRSQHNRKLSEASKLWDTVEASVVLGEISFILPGLAGQKAREVKQTLRAQRVRLCRDKAGGASKSQYDLDCLNNQRIELLGCGFGEAIIVHLPLADHVHQFDAGQDGEHTGNH
jgi:hypothetical protein